MKQTVKCLTCVGNVELRNIPEQSNDWNISPLSNNASLQICSYLIVRNIINWIKEWRTSTADATRKNKLYQAWARYHWQWNWPTVALISETTDYLGEYFLPYSFAPKNDGGYKLILNLKNLRVDVRKTQTKVKVSSKSWKSISLILSSQKVLCQWGTTVSFVRSNIVLL